MTDLSIFEPGLAQLRLRALYRYDERGRSLTVNEWDGGAAPRFHLMRTAQESFAIYRADLNDDLVDHLNQLRLKEPTGGQLSEMPSFQTNYLELLVAHGPAVRIWSGPVFLIPSNVVPRAPTVLIDEGNRHLLCANFDAWLPDVQHRQPFVAVIDRGRAISICASVRITEAVHCAGVETAISHRRAGHAATAVAAWALSVRSFGATPFYSTSWNNVGSQRVAARLGLAMIAVDFHIT
jgi:hypothetical protein